MHAQRFMDSVHGDIRLSATAAQVLCTREYSRLSDVKQLGGCFFVYPTATHTRREHSIGVAHLATRVGHHLAQKGANISNDDILCLELAGLVHDLGHGPFSHTFESFMGDGWSHEAMSERLFSLILRRHGIDLSGEHSTPENEAFVNLLVRGIGNADAWPAGTGRGEEKRFLAEVVHSRGTGVDVDKLDYLLRDNLAVFGTTNAFCVERIIRAMNVQNNTLTFDARSSFELAELFRLRATLHHRVYQHPSVLVVEGLLKTLMCEVDDSLPQAERLRVRCREAEGFVDVTDASVLRLPYHSDVRLLAGGACRAYDALFHRPWMRRLQHCLPLDIRPKCAACTAPTEVRHAFCSACGTSTRSRPGVADERGVLDSREAIVRESMIRSELDRHLGVDGLRVYVMDYHVGASVETTDPYGRVWRERDPLRNVRFTHPGDAEPHRVHSTHVRMIYAFVPTSIDESTIEDLEQKFRWWRPA